MTNINTGRLILLFTLFYFSITILSMAQSKQVHTWEMIEIELKAEKQYDNPYTNVTCWINLKGPNFNKRIYGYWDGGNIFKFRIVATSPGVWKWNSSSNQPDDVGLNKKQGSFTAINWPSKMVKENPNRKGSVKASDNGHALVYADGSPFFMVGDTWLAGTTWRLPFRNAVTDKNYEPAPGIGFEDAVIYRKEQGFNSVSMISSFPNWESDIHPSTYANSDSIFVRNAWEKFGYDVSDAEGIDASGGLSYWGTLTAKNMRDEYGNPPFEPSKIHKGVSDFDRINPDYFKSLDKKMEYLSAQGFVPLLETIRRDAGPTWKAYHDFNKSYARYFQYIISRYGAYNIIFSGIHLDWIPKDFSLTADEFNEALTYHLNKYGEPPFGQPITVLINNSTYRQFGHNDNCPWLNMHSVGNKPRDHRVSGALDTLFNLTPAYPAINFEPYYTGWNHEINKPNGERPPANSERDNYFSRAQMYGSVLSGGLSGHVHGTASYDITTTGEPEGARPHIWEALKYNSANYMNPMSKFILSEGDKYQDLHPAREDVVPNKSPNSPEKGLDGWLYMMRTEDKKFALLYFENESVVPQLKNFLPNKSYTLSWYDTKQGAWINKYTLDSDNLGILKLSKFPDNNTISSTDYALKILIEDK